MIRDGARVALLTEPPSGDHYTGEIAFDQEGWVYVGNGTVTNSGVVGDDNFRFGWDGQSRTSMMCRAKDGSQPAETTRR